MRPIVSNINSPTYETARYLVNPFHEIGEPDGFQVKNTFDKNCL